MMWVWLIENFMQLLLINLLNYLKKFSLPRKYILLKWMRRGKEVFVIILMTNGLQDMYVKNPRLQEIEYGEEEEEEVDKGIQDLVLTPKESIHELVEEMEVSILALSSSFNNSSMIFLGQVGSFSFDILVNSSSTHNFIDPLVATVVKMRIEKKATMEVNVSNGQKLVSQGKGQQLTAIQGVKFLNPFHVLPMVGCDAVLGV